MSAVAAVAVSLAAAAAADVARTDDVSGFGSERKSGLLPADYS